MMNQYDSLWRCIDPDLPGFFACLEDLGVPWSDDLSAASLDDVYLGTYSGGKPPAPIVRRMAESNEGPLTSAQMIRLAGMAHAMNASDWGRIWEAEVAEYDPISNYDMTEQMADDIHEKYESGTGSTTYGRTDTRTDNLTDSYGRTLTRTDNLRDARTGTESTQGETESESATDSTHKVYGLNSSTAVPSDEDHAETEGTETASQTITHNVTDSHTGTQTTGQSGSDTHTGTQAHALGGSDSRSDSRTSTDTHSYTLTRRGNIGVTTAQDMLTQERTLRAWRLFYDRVFPDLDRVLTLCTY